MSVKLLKTTTDGTVSQKSNEIHLKLNNMNLTDILLIPRVSLQHGLIWAIGLSFLGLNS